MKGIFDRVNLRRFIKYFIFFFITVLSSGCVAEPKHHISRKHSLALKVSNSARVGLSVTYHPSDSRQPIGACLSVTNLSRKNTIFQLSTKKFFDFSIYRKKGEKVWQWSQGKTFTETKTEIVMAPGETKSYRISIPSNIFHTGDYVLKGVFLGTPLLKPEIEFSIVR